MHVAPLGETVERAAKLIVAGQVDDRLEIFFRDLAVFPEAERVELVGQRHIAFAADPGSFAAAVLEFSSSR